MRNVPSRRSRLLHFACLAAWLLKLALPPVLAQPVVLVDTNSSWRLFKGTAEPSPNDRAAWRTPGFNDAAWPLAPAPFGYGEPTLFAGSGTQFPEMQNAFSTVYLRRKFSLANPSALEGFELKAICDDGFVAWLNGTEVARLNPPTGEPLFNALAGANVPEPIALTTYPIPSAAASLVAGENVLAVQVFNTSLGSSDLFFDALLSATPRPSESPVVRDVQPVPGVVASLDRIQVIFSESVRGVTADDFLINGASASRVEGSGATYTFFFTQPAYGPVEIRWGTLHGIEDFETPPRRFEISGPGAVWGYELLDPVGPKVALQYPPPGSVVSQLRQVEVTFDKAVLGVDASDLLRNGVAATNVTGIGAGPYLFEFPGVPAGTATVSFAPDHGIQSDAFDPRALSPTSWSYSVQPQVVPASLRITEFMAENFTALRDEDQDPEDWIEIQNFGSTAVNLAGWSLSREQDEPGMWVFPAVTLAPGGFLVVHASGKDRSPVNPTLRLHTNFKLNPSGGYLGLFGPELPRQAVSEVYFPEQGPNHSYARENNSGEWRYFLTGTPGSANGVSPIQSTVADVQFSVPRGFFNGTFQLTLTCPTPESTIRFTTNGSPPTLTEGFTYTNAIPIDVNRVIRAAAFRTNTLPSRVVTHSYLVNQTATRLRIPALSLVTATNNLYGRTGIMEVNPRNTTKRGAAWERPVSVEWIRPEDNDGFQADCGLRVQGGDYVRGQYNYRSTQLPFSKYSFRLYFRREYGHGRLDYPLFPETTQTSFDTVVLRAGMNDVSNPFLTDEFVRSLVRDTGQPSPSGTFVHLFLNGVYKGYYNPCERVDVDFLRAYHGGGEKWDLMAQYGEVREGDATAFNTLRTLATTRDLTVAANYRDITSRLDVTNFVDYLLPLIYVDNDDWPHNNWRAARERVPGGLYRMYCWDAEWAFGLVNGHAPSWDTIRNQLSSTSPPWGGADIQRIFLGLKKSPEFRQLFADRAHRHFFNDGALTDNRLRARYSVMTNRLAGIVSGLNTRIITTWIPQRRNNVLQHLDRAGFLASSNAPGFNRFGGPVPTGFSLTLTNVSGTIYYTTNGTDPRVAFVGAVAPDAKPYAGPLRIDSSVHVRARSLVNTTNWSAITEAVFEVNQIGMPLVISEIMYNPPGGAAFEYLEIHNHGSLPLDLTGYSFLGINFRFPDPTPPLPAGGRWVLANNARPADFAARYPSIQVAGWYGGSLDNAGEKIEIIDPNGRLITSIVYGNEAPWPVEADGGGASLEFSGPHNDPHDPAAWFVHADPGGSPGLPSPPQNPPSIRLSEIAAEPAPKADWIELVNVGPESARLDGWSLSDDRNPRRFVFPTNVILAAGSRLQVWCDTNAAPGWHTGFGLSDRGETLALYDPSGRRIDAVTFGSIPAGYSLARSEASMDWNLAEPTPASANELAATAEASQLTINEWLANPTTGNNDWIEFHNLSPSRPLSLRGVSVGTSNALTRIRAHTFIPASGFLTLDADEEPGPDHLGIRLPGTAGSIVVWDPNGVEVNRVAYRIPMEGHPVGAEGITLGRFPDGKGAVIAFPGTPSPNSSNYRSPAQGPRLNELMAFNASRVLHPSGYPSDWIEIHNPGTTTYDLTGFSIAIGANAPGEWTFPPNVRIAPNGHLVLWCDPTTQPTATQGTAPLNLGRGLPSEGGKIWLYDTQDRIVDHLVYGHQLSDAAVGRIGTGSWALLESPTPGGANAPAAILGASSSAKINEWLSDNPKGADWIELHNPESFPVDLGGYYLTDDPSVAGTTRFQIAPLTLLPARGHQIWIADPSGSNAPDHLPFGLDTLGETLRLYGPSRTLIDSVSFGSQFPSLSNGRFPDGSDRIEDFPGSASPGESNWRIFPGLVVSEVLSHTDPPLEDAIEFLNTSSQSIDLSGWLLSNSTRQPDKFRVPDGVVVAAGGFYVAYEKDFNPPGNPSAFTLNSAHGDAVWLSEVDPTGIPTGYRVHLDFGATANGISLGRHRTSVGWDYAPLSRLTFGRDLPTSLAEFRQGAGQPNAYPLVGPIVISEFHAQPANPTPTTPDEVFDDEFLEIHNSSHVNVPLYDPGTPTNPWRIRGGIQFDFPPNAELAARGFALVIRWSPDSPAAASFRTRRKVPASVPLWGPFQGRLNNSGEIIRLERPDRPQTRPSPDAGFVPYLLVESVEYRSGPAWPQGPEESEASLQRRRVAEYANDPVNWIAATPSPGLPTPPPLTDPDFDGMPSDWETAFGLDPGNPADAEWDADNDGLSNLAEFLAGTRPRDPASALRITLTIQASGGLAVHFPTIAHRSYSVLIRDSAAHGEWRSLTDLPAQSFDDHAHVPLGLLPSANSFLKVVTPALPPSY